ncbi:MAG: immunoglobulin domain-containing protein [Chitinophagaceae bacterium]|nr:immunoglobulin domain-containing protein [Chitinophagaceae bacterium]
MNILFTIKKIPHTIFKQLASSNMYRVLYTGFERQFICMTVMVLFISLFSSCSKNDVECNSSPPVITVATSVEAGGNIELKVESIGFAEFYHWEGPDNFVSEDQNPILTNVQPYNSGRYTLRVGVTGGCMVEAISDSVIITVPEAPCSPGTNQGLISDAGAGSMSFYSVICGTKGDSYFMTANSSAGDLELQFAGIDKPVDGLYSIQPLGGDWNQGDVRVRLVASSSNWPSYSGNVYVKNSNNKISATFCDIPVTSQTYNFSTTASGNVTEK